MADERHKLLAAAKQLLESERMLGGDPLFLPRSRNPLPAPQPPAGAAAPPATAAAPAGTARTAHAAHAAQPQARVLKQPAAPSVPAAPAVPTEPLPDMTPHEKADALAELAQQAESCGLCPLGPTRTRLVFGEGNPAARLVFVGEAPGEDEDRTGRPFVGRAGQKLTEMIVAMGLSRSDVYICNMCKCRPPGNRTPNPQEIAACWPYLVRQLQIIRPEVIVTLGNPATQSLLKTTIGITKIRGQWQSLPAIAPGLEGTPVMPTLHPSYVLRQYTMEIRKAVWSDLQKVMEKLGLPQKR
jgi:DNA polymerase